MNDNDDGGGGGGGGYTITCNIISSWLEKEVDMEHAGGEVW